MISKAAHNIDPATFESARAGNEAALDTVLAVSQPDIRRYARHTCREMDVDDATQETLLILARRVGTIKMLAALPSWLFIVVKRICMKTHRKLAGKRFESIESHEDDVSLSSRPTHELRLDLIQAILSLPDHFRDIILLRDVKGMTVKEIADQSGETQDSIKSRLHRARLLVRENLKQTGD